MTDRDSRDLNFWAHLQSGIKAPFQYKVTNDYLRQHYKIQECGGGGDCLFLSLAGALNIGKTGPDIRKETCDYIFKDGGRLQSLKDRLGDGKDFRRDIDEFEKIKGDVRNCYKPGVFGNTLTLIAAANVYGVCIVVVRQPTEADPEPLLASEQPDPPGTFSRIVFLDNQDLIHFRAWMPKAQKPPPATTMQKQPPKAPQRQTLANLRASGLAPDRTGITPQQPTAPEARPQAARDGKEFSVLEFLNAQASTHRQPTTAPTFPPTNVPAQPKNFKELFIMRAKQAEQRRKS